MNMVGGAAGEGAHHHEPGGWLSGRPSLRPPRCEKYTRMRKITQACCMHFAGLADVLGSMRSVGSGRRLADRATRLGGEHEHAWAWCMRGQTAQRRVGTDGLTVQELVVGAMVPQSQQLKPHFWILPSE